MGFVQTDPLHKQTKVKKRKLEVVMDLLKTARVLNC